jgi:hypothetical protein
MAKAAFGKGSFHQEKLVKCYIWRNIFMALKLGHFGKQIRNTWKVLKCGAAEGRRRSGGLIV